LSRDVPKRDIDGSKCIDIKAARIAAHAHQVIEIVMDGSRIRGIAANGEIGKQVINDGDDRTRGDQPISLAPAGHSVPRPDAHQHAAVEGRIDSLVALADEIATRIRLFSRTRCAEIGRLTRYRESENLDAGD